MINTNGICQTLDQRIELVVCEITRHTVNHRISKPELRIELFLVYATQKFWVESDFFSSTNYTYGDLIDFIERYRQNVTCALALANSQV